MNQFLVFTLGLLLVLRIKASEITEDDYNKFPKLFQADNYDECMKDRHGLYCLLDIELTSDGPSELIQKIKNFSAEKEFFRHDILHRGLCVSQRCHISGLGGDYMPLQAELQDCALPYILEWAPDPGLKGTVMASNCTSKPSIYYYMFRIFFTIAIYLIAVTNVSSTVFLTEEKIEGKWTQRHFCFNLQNNLRLWRHRTPREGSAGGLKGLKFILTNFMILTYYFITLYRMYLENPEFLESIYATNFFRFMSVSALLTQAYFCMTSFFLAYSFLQYADRKSDFDPLGTFKKFVNHRWKRLTPAYAVTLGFVTLWIGYFAKGPLTPLVQQEITYCLDSWLANVLYLQNIVGSIRCMPQTWILAVDFQYYCMALAIIMLICKYPDYAQHILGATLMTGVLVPGVLTYIRNYPAVSTYTPECMRESCLNQPDVLDLHVSFKGNIVSPAIGILGGYIQYYIKKNGISISNHKLFTSCLKAVFPGLLGVAAIGMFFGTVSSAPLVAAIHVSLSKVIVSSLFIVLFIGITNNCDLGMLNFLKSDTMELFGCLSYSVLLSHVTALEGILSYLHIPVLLGPSTLFWLPIAAILVSYLVGMCLFFTIELPFKNLLILCKNEEKQMKKECQTAKEISVDYLNSD